MAIFGSNNVTGDGHALLAKVLAGKCRLHFTKVQAGDGFFDGDVMELTQLVNLRLEGKITGVIEEGTFSQVSVLITNQFLDAFMEFREVGLRATGILPDGSYDPELGESGILFSYANAGNNASPIGPFNGVWLHEEAFTMRTYTANATNITAEIVITTFASEIQYDNTESGLASDNIQGAIDELATHTRQTVRFENGVHGLRYYNGGLQVYDGVCWIPITNFGDALAIHNTDPSAHSAKFQYLQDQINALWAFIHAQFPDSVGAVLGADSFLGTDAYMV